LTEIVQLYLHDALPIFKFDGGQSMSKTQFHSIYKDIEILELRKDGKKIDLSTLAESTDALNDWEEGANKVGKDGGEAIKNTKDLDRKSTRLNSSHVSIS